MSFKHSLGLAVSGVLDALRAERNMKIHLFTTLIVVGLGFYFQLTSWEWALIVFAISLVWASEIINTSLEQIIDMISPEYSPAAARGKNLAAGAVLVLVINAVVVGLLVFLPYVLAWWRRGCIV